LNTTLTKILKLANDLTKPELMALNQAIVALIKSLVDEEVTKASSQFNKGDIVSFADNNNIRRHGVITKRNQKTFQVITPEHYSINVKWLYFRGQILYKDFNLKKYYYDKEKEFLFARI